MKGLLEKQRRAGAGPAGRQRGRTPLMHAAPTLFIRRSRMACRRNNESNKTTKAEKTTAHNRVSPNILRVVRVWWQDCCTSSSKSAGKAVGYTMADAAGSALPCPANSLKVEETTETGARGARRVRQLPNCDNSPYVAAEERNFLPPAGRRDATRGGRRRNASTGAGLVRRTQSRVCESRLSSPPLDIRHPRGVTSALPVEIGYLIEGKRMMEGGRKYEIRLDLLRSGREIDASHAERLERLSIACFALSLARSAQAERDMSHAFSCVQPAFIDL
ncbi:hypothetical protein EVAR_18689_1 [Eumeta japonica]|uniref:Uncharacterized protein n=1 Tax=Eumeta variegata TaxID=151549 RepID=A0A4C1U703_EUMVA|nr:hypothetical protein EVAR_18689_1 [Eumeta japonica]